MLYALSAAMPVSNSVVFHSAAIDVVVERNLDSDDFRFPTIPLPLLMMMASKRRGLSRVGSLTATRLV